MRLRRTQRNVLLTWIAEGLETGEINQRAASFKPRFKVTKQQVDFYRKSRGLKLEEIKDADETGALTTGLAIKENRVATLKKMADKIIADLFPEDDLGNLRWLKMAKTVAKEQYDYKDFNRAEFEALRGVLNDIAAELGERQPGVQVTNNFNFDMEEWKKTRSQRLKEVEALAEVEAD